MISIKMLETITVNVLELILSILIPNKSKNNQIIFDMKVMDM